MKPTISDRNTLFFRTTLALAMIVLAAVLRIVPHPWNFAPIGAIALFSGAMIRDKRLALFFPLLTLIAGDLFIGFHKLIPLVYASTLVNVALGFLLRDRKTLGCVAGVTLLGAIQFFLVTNFGVWLLLGTFPKTALGLVACYIAGAPLFWNTLASDVLYVTLLFGGFALAERLFPALQKPVAAHV
ncbi:MAG: DUF6580 family putative transport protein [Candidatus Acidiferrales bacterium]